MSVDPNISKDDILQLLDKIRYDATAIQSKITELKTMVAHSKMEKPKAGFACPRCGVVHKTEQRLLDHLELVHS